ncbi:hypothetical protein [Fangia hongkongensis]|uniref:hypothetical protein n=3 Tax=Fangia hongkongensis TaxID=270495 RepID=UPI0003692908|nr:hypothetical protein [Fangia hongkongensis]
MISAPNRERQSKGKKEDLRVAVHYNVLRVSLIPIDQKTLTLKQDKEVVLLPNYLDMLMLDMNIHGFQGVLHFSLSALSNNNSKLDFLFSDGVFAIDVTIDMVDKLPVKKDKQIVSDKNSDQHTIKLTGLCTNAFEKVDTGDNFSYELSDLDYTLDNSDIKIFSARQQYQFKFFDPLSAMLKKLSPFTIYSQSNYKGVFEDLLSPFSKLFEYKIDNAWSALNSDQHQMICVNCIDRSLYDFLLEVLYQYNGYLLYDAASNQYLLTHDLKQEIDKKNTESVTFQYNDLYRIHNLSLKRKRAYIGPEAVVNTDYLLQSTQSLINPVYIEKDQLIKSPRLSSYRVPNQFTNSWNLHSKKAKNQLSKNYTLKVNLYESLTYMKLQPLTMCDFSKLVTNYYSMTGFSKGYIARVLFKVFQPEDAQNARAYDTHERLTAKVKYQLPELRTMTSLEFVDDQAQSALIEDYKKASEVTVTAKIVTLSQDNTKPYDYKVFKGQDNEVASVDDMATENASGWQENPYCKDEPSYHVELSKEILSEKSTNLFPLVVKRKLESNQTLFPFRRGSIIYVNCQREYLLFQAVDGYQLNKEKFVSTQSQISGINMGDKNEANIRYQIDQEDSQLFIEQENQSGQKVIILNKDGIELSVGE